MAEFMRSRQSGRRLTDIALRSRFCSVATTAERWPTLLTPRNSAQSEVHVLLAKILDTATDIEKVDNQVISFYRLGNALLSTFLSKGMENPLGKQTASFYMANRRGLAPYAFPVGSNDDTKARTVAFLLSDDLLRRLVFCDFYIVESNSDATFVEQLADGRKIAAISICDDALLGNELFGGIIRQAHSFEELNPRSTLADTPCLMPLSAKFIPFLSGDNIEDLPKLLLSLIPLLCTEGKSAEGEPRMLRVLHVLDESAVWHWRYKGDLRKVDLSRQCNGRYFELEASLISEADGSADDLFGGSFDIEQLEMPLAPFDVNLDSCGARIRIVNHQGGLVNCVDWDKQKCEQSIGCEQEGHIRGPAVDEKARRKLEGHVLRLPDTGFYGPEQLWLRASNQKASAELARFDFSSGTPQPRNLTGVPCPSDADGFKELRSEFGRLLESMNGYCEKHQPYRTSMLPYFETTADCVGSHGPLRLFRFRSLSDSRTAELNLEDIRQGRLFLARARDFNDLYDSFPLLNLDSIREQMDNLITEENMVRTLKSDAHLCAKRLPLDDDITSWAINQMEKKDEFIESSIAQLGRRTNEFRNELRCVCLSEDVGNSLMWGLYADSGKGIAVEYELDPRNLKCYCEQKCESCMCATLAPVQYGERPDMSWLAHVLGGSAALSDYPEGTTYLYLVNTAFKKTKQWEHEKEWRVACGTCEKADGPKYLAARAKAIYLGQKIGEADRQKVIEVAEDTGIPLYEMRMTNDPAGQLAFEPHCG